MKETDLFAPVRDHFEGEGFKVAAEVQHCDVVALKDDELVIIELKRSLNMTLLTQALARQSLTDTVYIAIPEPAKINRRFRAQQRVVKRLGLGLLTIYESPLRQVAQVRLTPSWEGRINQRKRTALLKEFSGRTLQLNEGGATGVPIYTAYRETAITLANLIEINGPSRVAQLRPWGGTKTQTILARNVYGWFTRVSRGIYELTDLGREALAEYPELNALITEKIRSSGQENLTSKK